MGTRSVKTDWPWRSLKVSELFELQLGKMLDKAARTLEPNYLYLTNRNVQWGRMELDGLNRMHFSEKEKQKFSLRPGDLLVCEGGEVGRSALWSDDEIECYFQKALHRLRPKTSEISPHFMLYFMHFAAANKLLEHLTSQSSIAHLTRKKLAVLEVPIPPLAEQRKIAAILSSVDEAIEKTQAVIDQVQVVKKGLMQELLTRGLPGRHTRFKQTEIGEVPEEWAVGTLGQFIDGIDAGWSPKCEPEPAVHQRWGVLKVSAVSSGAYKQLENKQLPLGLEPRPELEVKAGDVVVARASGVIDLVGVPAYVWETRPLLMLSDKTLRIRPRPERLDGFFMFTALQLPAVREFVLQGATGSHMRNISQKALKATPVPVPPLDEQLEISRVLRETQARLRAEKLKLNACAPLKQSLLSVLLTGEVRVQIDDEAAA